MTLTLEVPNSPTFSTRAASELAGELLLNPAYLAFSQAELEQTVQQIGEELRSAEFAVGDAALVYVSRAGSRATDRARALEELSGTTGVTREQLWRCVRVSRAFAPGKRDRFEDKTRSWFDVITDRTALDGDTPELRQERRETYAERCAEMNAHQARQLIDAELRPSQARVQTRADFLEVSDAPHPVATEAPPAVRPVASADDRFRKQLIAAYSEWQPGTAQLVADMVFDVLGRGWKLTEATP